MSQSPIINTEETLARAGVSEKLATCTLFESMRKMVSPAVVMG